MVKITRTSTKYPSPTKEFLPYGNVALCFPCLSQEQRCVLQSTGTNLLPHLVYTVAVASAWEGARRFLARGKRKPFLLTFQENAHWPRLNTPAIFFIPSPLDCYLYQSQFAASRQLPPISLSHTLLQGQTEICCIEDLPVKTQRKFKRSGSKRWERNL